LNGETNEDPRLKDKTGESNEVKPIAELFPNTTVLFADIAGFTAWSSAREPSQVFTLLETLYRTFDKAAKRRGVFKVETIGDCYMAVTGLPDPQEDHAVIMARFAQDCLSKMREVTRKLELTLGPDTAELSLRIGIHSGPVTAGVLRGEKSRFQLFGDTVNTASRMESTGQKDRIQVSQQTADLLTAAGKPHWMTAREDMVFAKGKGDLNTFWLDSKAKTPPQDIVVTNPTDDSPSSLRCRSNKEFLDCSPASDCNMPDAADGSEDSQRASSAAVDAPHRRMSISSASKAERMIKWNADILERSLKAILAYRGRPIRRRAWSSLHDMSKTDRKSGHKPFKRGSGMTEESKSILDEVVETIAMPMFDSQKASRRIDTETIVLSSEIRAQLFDYVTAIASMYQENPFHCFEHASHVTMSANKLLQRIVMPDETEYRKKSPPLSSGSSTEQRRREKASALHKYTFGITSDPLTQFAILFSAFIHDVAHPGLSNRQLVNKQAEMALRYNNKSVAEQNSINIAWNLLMEPRFNDLRRCIAPSEEELKRFRQIVINSVIATDIFDDELQILSKSRWTNAFQNVSNMERTPLAPEQEANRKATIVIEHLLQASDVAHTMQHFQLYCKWNERLFREMYAAYVSGDASTDPSVGWYHQELEFFDGYVIPLAMKLKECGVFGVSGDEYLTYAMENRREWAQKGKDIVNAMLLKLNTKGQSIHQNEELEDSTLEFVI
jgi:class 3 adenylate cyclase